MSDREILETLLTLARVCLGLGGTIIALQLAAMYLKWRVFRATEAYLGRAEARQKKADETLELVKEWSSLAHIQHKDAKRVIEKVEQKAEEAAAVVEAVEAVPEKTAERVVEKISQSAADSGRMKVVAPPPAQGGGP